MSKDFMVKQLTQVFTYAELLKRLLEFQKMLDIEDGFQSEKEIYDKTKELESVIRENLKLHLSNSNVSERAMIIINNNSILNKMNN